MRRIKRARFLFFSIEAERTLDLGAFFSGQVEWTQRSQIVVHSLLTGAKHPVDETELRFLLTLAPDSWSEIDPDPIDLQHLADRGLIITDSDDPAAVEMRRRDELLAARAWNPYAALFHFLGRAEEPAARNVDVEALAATAAEDSAAYVERHGPAPPAFHRRAPEADAIALPRVDKTGELYDVLLRRRTTRAFDTSRLLPLEPLTVLLRVVFGCYGYAQPTEGFVALQKTSPSGGSLHPVEAYPLVLRVEDLKPGFYHYDVERHALEPLVELALPDAEKLAVEIAGGQNYAGTAHFLVVLTARFFRNFWKYRRRSRTYAVLLMDAAHLSQTFYLVATELGLGAFFSAAVNAARIEETLGLEALEEGPLGVCGCGIKKAGGSAPALGYLPYVPGSTEI